ncbi:MAG: DMP19 family protein [Burkholderiales bacterium]|nr:DMP19 family protein [Burkholderiales bacterium]
MFAIKNLTFDETHLNLELQDGALFRQSLKRHAKLAQADAQTRTQWRLNEARDSIVWSNIDGREVSIDLYEWVWEAICDHALENLQSHGWDVKKVSQKTYDIASIWRLEADGYNGGFLQFFCNWGEDNCQTALSALQDIGATATHQVLAAQRALIQRLEDAPEMTRLDELPALLTEQERDEIGERLDHALWDAMMEIPPLAVRYYGWQDLILEQNKHE